MEKLPIGAYTGSADKGNPFQGDLGKGISYDTYEANFPRIIQEGDFPYIANTYRTAAKNLLKYLPALERPKFLDLGSGTGICTLEILCQNKDASVLGVEISEGMLLVAKYKFHHDEGKELLAGVKDEKLLDYWRQFRKESEVHKDKVSFLQGDFQEVEQIEPESIDLAAANQFMHWTDLTKSFTQLNKFLRKGGMVVWNSASHFYDDKQFPSAKYGFRYNDFMKYVLEEVNKTVNVKEIYTLSVPKYNFCSIESITSEQGFETKQVATGLAPVDLQTFIKNHVPIFVKALITSEIGEEELKRITREAIAKTINNPKALEDTTHKYDILPVFRSVKKS